MQESRPSRWPILLGAIFLAYLVSASFAAILTFDFIHFDVNDQLIENPYVHGLTGANLRHIFTSRCVTSYYPVRSLTYALDYQVWGLNPRGFKLTNLLIHLTNVLLVFWFVLRLRGQAALAGQTHVPWWDVSVATFSAGIFAVHPVVVEPVTWVSGREELLMTLGALGCLHFHVTARRFGEIGGRTYAALACYGCAALACTAACLSNVVGAVIPLLIVAWDVLTLPPPKWRKILTGTSALWAASAATLAIKIAGESRETVGAAAHVFSAQWLMRVLHTYALNLKTLVWPKDLTLFYQVDAPRGFLDPGVLLGALAIGSTCVILWTLRRQKLTLFGLLWFGVALAPSGSQVIPHLNLADRFLYLPLVGLAIALAAGLGPLRNVLKGLGPRVRLIALCFLALLLSGTITLLDLTSVGQIRTWQDDVTLWQHCLGIDDNNPRAHCCLADALCERGRFREAMRHYRIALSLDPVNMDALNNFAYELAACDDRSLRHYELAVELATRARQVDGWKQTKSARTLAFVYTNYATSLTHDREWAAAIALFRKARKADPQYEPAAFALAYLLATCPDRALRRPDEAVRLAERACELVGKPNSTQLTALAAAYAEAGQFTKAVAAGERAVAAAEAAGDAQAAERLRAQLQRYLERIPSPQW